MNLAAMFRDAHPRGLDFPQSEYEAAKLSYDGIAADYGYRLAGIRLGRAVFTTKKMPAPDAATIPQAGGWAPVIELNQKEGVDNGRQ